jgi:hypothetical protein
MEQIINEVNVDNVIPFDKTKTGLSIRKEQLINKTLLQLDEYLTRINKFSIRELKEEGTGCSSSHPSGVFDLFYIGDEETKKTFFWNGKEPNSKIPFLIDCSFEIRDSHKPITLETSVYYERGGSDDPERFWVNLCRVGFGKKNISTKFDRKKTSISMSKQIFSSFGTETEMEEFFQRCIFHKENNETKEVKVKEYPIKEIVSFEMDDNGIWSLRYNEDHPSFPKHIKEQYKEFLKQTTKFCEENDFLLERGSGKMLGMNNYSGGYTDLEWDEKRRGYYKWWEGGKLPFLLYPRIILKGYFPQKYQSQNIEMEKTGKTERDFPYSVPVPYYGNTHYKKYIEDNNGECLLPLPVDENWYVDTSVDEDKVYRVKITQRPEVRTDMILLVPKGVEINQLILENSYYDFDTQGDIDFSISEVDKELWNDDDPTLDNDGEIIFGDEKYCE